MKKLILLIAICTAALAVNAQVLKRDFLAGYTVNANLEKGAYSNTTQGEGTPIMINQWNFSGKTGANDQSGANPKTVDPLYYTAYVESGENVAIELIKLETGGRTSIYSLSNDNTYGAGTYYLSFMINISMASLTSTVDFVSFDGNYTGNAQRARLTIKGIDETTFQLGMGDAGVATTFSPKNLSIGQTHLVVIKVTIDGEGTGNSWLYINPSISNAEPTVDATTSITGTALKSIRGIVIRQRSSYGGHVGGFRLASSWAGVLGTSTGLNDININNIIKVAGKSIITENEGSIRIFNLAGAEVLNAPTQGRLQTNLPKGLYMIKFIDKSGITSTTKANLN